MPPMVFVYNTSTCSKLSLNELPQLHSINLSLICGMICSASVTSACWQRNLHCFPFHKWRKYIFKCTPLQSEMVLEIARPNAKLFCREDPSSHMCEAAKRSRADMPAATCEADIFSLNLRIFISELVLRVCQAQNRTGLQDLSVS